MKVKSIFIAILVVLVVISGCSNEKPEDVKKGSIILPNEIALSIDDSMDLVVQFNNLSEDSIVSWSVSDTTLIRLTQPSSLMSRKARIKALKTGEVSITASLATGESTTCLVKISEKIKEIPLVSFIHLEVGAEKEIEGLKAYQFNSVTILDESIAEINNQYFLKGVSEGYTYLSVKNDIEEKIIKISVTSSENIINQIDINDEKNEMLNYYGRSSYEESLSAEMFYFTGSGFEVSFFGTELKASLLKDKNDVGNGSKLDIETILYVFLADNYKGENLKPDKEIKISASNFDKQEYIIIDGLKQDYHTVKVFKRTAYMRAQMQMTTFGLSALSTDGFFVHAPDMPKFKIEVYGDSISCGFGNLTDGATMTSANTDGLMSYQYILGRKLNATVNTVAASGWGIHQGLVDNTAWSNESDIVGKDHFEKVVPNKLSSWDFTKYSADIVIINLGANDNTAGVFKDESITIDFISSYKSFISKLRSYYPNAKFICTYGMTSKNANAVNAINKVVEEAGDKDVYSYFYKNGASSHPTVNQHKVAAIELYDFIVENILK